MQTQEAASGQVPPKAGKMTRTAGSRKRLWGWLIPLALVLLALFGAKSCTSAARRSVQANAPRINLPPSDAIRDNIPVYEKDIQLQFVGNVAFLEIVSNEVYQRERSTTLRKLFPGRLLGGKLLMIGEGEQSLSLPVVEYQSATEAKWWIRGASHVGTVTYEENLDRILYSLVGRPVDALCGHLVDRVGPGGLYGPDEFPQYAVGEFEAFIISPIRK